MNGNTQSSFPYKIVRITHNPLTIAPTQISLKAEKLAEITETLYWQLIAFLAMLKPTTYKSPMHILPKIVQMANMWNEFHWKFGNTSVHNYQNGLSDLWATFSVGFKKKEKKKIFILPVAV